MNFLKPAIGVIIAVLLFSPAYAQQKKNTPAPPSVPAEPKKPVYAGKDIPQGVLDNLFVKVGAGGVTKGDYDFFLLKTANKNGKNVDALTPDERKTALFSAIDEELLFQGALAEGVLKDEYTCWRILETYKSNNTTAKIDPRTFTDDELEKFYKAHPGKFTKPASVNAKGLKFMTESDQDVQKVMKQVAANPDSVKNWIELGWIEEGKMAAGLPQRITDPITKLKKGQNSGIVYDKSVDWRYIFLVTDRKEPELIPYSEAKGKVKFELIGAKQEEMKKKLAADQGKGQKGLSEDEILLNSAIQAGTHRDLMVKRYIVEWYFSKKNAKREEALPELKKKYKIEILKSE
ncbi:MAG: peptidylprolyl isomerase [Victivallales bacterium]